MSKSEIDYNEIQKLLAEYHSSRWKSKKQRILNIIVLTCMPIIKKIAYSIARRYSDPVEDIIQIGSLGLIKAIYKYNPTYNNPKSYLYYSILWDIKHYYRDKALQEGATYTTIELAIRTDNFDIDDIDDNTEYFKTKEKLQDKKIIEKRHVISLDELQFKDENNKTLGDNILNEDEKYNIDYLDELNSNKMILEKAIKQLSLKHQELIQKIYYKGYSQAKLAKEWKTKQSNVSRLKKQAIALLTEIIKKDNKED